MKIERKLQKWDDCQVKLVGDEGVFAGYASVFGGIDSYNDTVMPGAYLETLAAGMPDMLFNHINRRSDMPAKVGRWTLAQEDSKGLYVEGLVTLTHPIIRNSWDTIKAGLFSGLSIGYYVPEGGASVTENGIRLLSKILLKEISLVEEPADPNAFVLIDSIKSLVSIRDVEQVLRDAGMSASEAKTFISKTKEILVAEKSQTENAELVSALSKIFN